MGEPCSCGVGTVALALAILASIAVVEGDPEVAVKALEIVAMIVSGGYLALTAPLPID